MKQLPRNYTRPFLAALAAIAPLACAQAGSFFSDFNSGLPSDTIITGSALISPNDGTGNGFTNSGCLQLTENQASVQGTFVITNDLDAGTPVVSFTASFKALIGSEGIGADGMSFNFAPDVDQTGNIDENGSGTGLTVTLRTYTFDAVEVKVGGAAVATATVPALRTGKFVDVLVQLNPDSTLNVLYDGSYVHSNLVVSYTPAAGSLFAFGARSGSVTDNQFIDNLSIVTRTNAGAFVQSFAPKGRLVPTNASIDIALTNYLTTVSSGSIVLKLDGATVTPTVTGSLIHYAPSSPFDNYTTHNVRLTFNDNATPTPNSTVLEYSFTVVPNYVAVFSDGFESYTAGGAALDMNYASGPNASANGNLAGNPWFGPAPPNAIVLGTDNGVVPHSGSQMIRGVSPSNFDENWYNLSYRQHNQIPYSGNIRMDWWFYDPNGAGDANYREYCAIGWYNLCPNNTDYPGTGSLNGSGQIQRLCLGADSNQSGGFDSSKYQTRVVGANDGYNSAGWFNTPVTRSPGWHHGRIVVEGKTPLSAPDVLFYLDDMTTPCFVHSAVLLYGGYNVLEINTAYGATMGYMDDLQLSVAKPPKLTVSHAGTSLVITWPGDGFVLQSASAPSGPWTDVGGAISGYSLDPTQAGSPLYFRLRP